MVPRKSGPPKRKNHAQDGGTLIASRDQYPAILPWFLCSGWRPSFRSYGHLPRPVAGLLLSTLGLSMIFPENRIMLQV
jgi:hypothetical protein